MRVTRLWRETEKSRREKLCPERKKILDNRRRENPPLQDFSGRPLFLGGDAVALYPSMDILGTSEIVTQAVINSKVKFRNINRKMLVIYLYLVSGGEAFRESG